MVARKAIRVTIYINEADQWQGRPMHLELLRFLAGEGCAGGTVLRAVAGFTRAAGVVTTSLVDTGGKLPLVIEYVDDAETVARVLPRLREMVGQRLITTEIVEVVP